MIEFRQTFLFILMLFSLDLCYAQVRENPRFGHVFKFEVETSGQLTGTREAMYVSISDTAIYQVFDLFRPKTDDTSSTTVAKTPLILGVKLNPGLTDYFSAVVKSFSKDFYTYTISDSSEAILVAMGINEKNYRRFRYRVVENDSIERISWSPVPPPSMAYGAKQPFVLIGRFCAPGRNLLVELVDKENYSVRDGVIFDWRQDFRPSLQQVSVSVSNAYFNLASLSLNRGYATGIDPSTGVPLNFRFGKDSVRSLLFSFRKQETIVNSVHLIRNTEEITDTVRLGFIDPYGMFYLGSEYFRKPGKYELIFQRQSPHPGFDPEQSLRIPFVVLEPPGISKDYWQIFLIVALILLTAFLLAVFISRQVLNRRLKRVARQKEMALLKIRNIRTQLNPHFVFNALGSIQNLINKNETGSANHYLTKFASLTRSVLETGESDLVSLDTELNLNENYLIMEKLRFGFGYGIECSSELNRHNIEIPPLLMQPFIENAVKHGVSEKTGGNIIIRVFRRLDDLVMQVADNGKGFDGQINNRQGFGIRLSKEYLVLLNEIYPGNFFSLDIKSDSAGTTVTLTITNWL